MISDQEYWWKQEDPSDIVKRLCAHTDRWSEYSTNPIAESWVRNIIAYYSCLLEPNDWQSALGFAGEQGELVRMSVPQARSIIRQIISLVTKERLAFQAIAETQGADVMADVRLGNAVAARMVIDEELDKKDEDAVEHACIVGMGFFKASWRTDKGVPYTVGENGVVIYDGKVEITTPLIQDVTWDIRLPRFEDSCWVQIRTMKNRWDLIAQHPELKENILTIPKILENHSLRTPQGVYPSDEDIIYVYEAYHKPTPALPLGRMVFYSDENTVYFDGDNYYGCIPVEPIVPESIYGMGYGYPIFSNLLPSQEMFDHSLSAIATNHSNLAVQSVTCPRNANINVTQIQGMNFMLYTPQNAAGGGKPEPLNLLQSSPEMYKFAGELSKYMLDVSYLNSAVRGSPPPGVTSGTAIATLTANAIEYLNGLSKANRLALERIMNLTVNIESKFAKSKRTVTIYGKNNQSFTREYDGSDLKNITKFKMQAVNPLMQTLGGRIDMAEKLLQTGIVKSAQDYVSILDGAPLSQLTESETSENDLIQAENDALMDGQPVMALVTDTHPEHVLKHKTLLNDPAVRFNNEMVERVLAHMQEHLDLAETGNQTLMAMAQTGKMPEGGIPPQQAPGPMPAPEEGAGQEMMMNDPRQGAAEPTEDPLAGQR